MTPTHFITVITVDSMRSRVHWLRADSAAAAFIAVAGSAAPACLSMNPIETYERLSAADNDRFAYCPLGYGYSNYARTGYRREAGHLSIQGHDPTTDLSFRNLRIAGYNDALRELAGTTDDKGPAPTYIDMIRHNIRTLAGALLS